MLLGHPGGETIPRTGPLNNLGNTFARFPYVRIAI